MNPDSYTVSTPFWLAKIRFRHLVQADLPALEWDGEYRHFRRLYAETFQSMLNGRTLMWGAELEGKELVGQLFVQILSSRVELADGKERAYIYGFRVKPPYRGYGIGSRFIQTVEADLFQHGYRRVTLNVSQENADARRLYERLGYHIVGSEPGEWSYRDEFGKLCEVHEPAWRMEKYLFYHNK